MARALRVEYPGALYHVYGRGIARQAIFRVPADRDLFLLALAVAKHRHHLLIHAYCLMSNHYHLLLETPEGNLSRAMRHINGTYTQRYNRVHRRTGQLLQGRFKANLVEKESYLLELARYIVLNPVRARMVSDPAAWAWSSYRATAGIAPAPAWLTTDWLLGAVGGRTKAEARRRYQAYMRQGIGERAMPEGASWGQAVIGGAAFLQWVGEIVKGRTGLEEVPRGQRHIGRPKLAALFKGVMEREERDRRIREAFGTHGYRLNEIAAAVGLHYSRVSHIANDGGKNE
jgi:putative transposase